ncbi:hypothetical protein GCM10019016_040620 [Streptomyces prasinosporus]|uniref:Uncharacterized protein n=1 Tax=Streptomyces prasinosporus TaxID=68256 RepID=A0ABP6TS81_9ACTN
MGVTVHTVEGTAEAGATVRPKAAAAAPATTANLLVFFFMAREISLWIDRQRVGRGRRDRGSGRAARGSVFPVREP